MLKTIVLYFLLFASLLTWGQKTGVTVADNDAFAYRQAKASFANIPLANNSIDGITNYVESTHDNFTNPASKLSWKYTKTSPGGKHYTFCQRFGGIEVFNTEMKVTVDNESHIRSIIDNSYNTNTWDETQLNIDYQYLKTKDIVHYFMQSHIEMSSLQASKIVIAVINGQPNVYQYVELGNINTGAYRMYLLDATGKDVYSRDMNSYIGGASSNATATGMPFLPDPLTRAHVYYGVPYVDSSNGKVAAVNAQRVLEDSLHVTKDSAGIYHLANNRVEVKDFSTPTVVPPTDTIADFSYLRGTSGFEATNAFYHISVHNSYIAAIGFDSLANFYTQVDVHALDGADNSQFSPLNNTPSIYYGDGGVPDAQDADVVVHEYSHAVSNNASPGSNSGMERTSLDEGMADYFATSYSRYLYEFRWADMFTWDGHNEYWPGRTADTTIHYPDGLSSKIHINGEMWSSSLMQIWGRFGRTVTDRLMLQTLYGFTTNMNFTQAALVFIQADSLLYHGAHACYIANNFYQRGFLNDSLFDSVMVNLRACALNGIDEPTQIGLKLNNTQAFSTKGEAAILVKPSGLMIDQITVTDIAGQVLWQVGSTNESEYAINAHNLPSGVYLLTVRTNLGYQTFKLVRL